MNNRIIAINFANWIWVNLDKKEMQKKSLDLWVDAFDVTLSIQQKQHAIKFVFWLWGNFDETMMSKKSLNKWYDFWEVFPNTKRR